MLVAIVLEAAVAGPVVVKVKLTILVKMTLGVVLVTMSIVMMEVKVETQKGISTAGQGAMAATIAHYEACRA